MRAVATPLPDGWSPPRERHRIRLTGRLVTYRCVHTPSTPAGSAGVAYPRQSPAIWVCTQTRLRVGRCDACTGSSGWETHDGIALVAWGQELGVCADIQGLLATSVGRSVAASEFAVHSAAPIPPQLLVLLLLELHVYDANNSNRMMLSLRGRGGCPYPSSLLVFSGVRFGLPSDMGAQHQRQSTVARRWVGSRNFDSPPSGVSISSDKSRWWDRCPRTRPPRRA